MHKSTIEATRIGVEKIQNRRTFTAEEMQDLREDYSGKAIEIMETEEAFALVKAEWQGKIKTLKAESKGILKDIKSRYEDEERECSLVPDMEAGTMMYYDVKTGEIVFSRKLRPNERQERMKLVEQEG